MPNTLAHIAINGFSTKKISASSSLLWIYLGCIIPDIPWIIRKIISVLSPSINGYDLQAYVIVQATLFFSIILSFSFSLFSKNILKTFLILSFGSLLHLLLDPIQIKWANGVHLFAPFSWDMTTFGIFWPESFITYLMTISGLIFFVFYWKELKIIKPNILFKKINSFLAFLIILIYFVLPLRFMNNVVKSDNHFISTLKTENERIGKYVEMDRKDVTFNEQTNSYWIKSFNKDIIELKNIERLNSNRISIKGRFISNNIIDVIEYHENWEAFRDGASYLGILLIIFSWILAFRNSLK
ncbi:MAG: hypothetical protein H6611_09280 [Ignavibacteriales bacterium]|nr:hypothetical protein [Ignavibacteriales bacterium]